MISQALVSRYASALVDVVTGPKGMDAAPVSQQLRAFEGLLSGSAELRNVLASPAVAASRKRAVVRQLADRLGVAKIVRNFLLVLTDHRRLPGLAQVVDSFEIQLDERLGFVRAELRTARELDERQKTELVDGLSRFTGKKVRARFAVEADLIGGVVAHIGSTLYDGSVRGELESLARRLAAE
jgi:F-type H+-transporting ATPase subunit delta